MSNKAPAYRLKLYIGLEERIIVPDNKDEENNPPLDKSISSEKTATVDNPEILENTTLSKNNTPVEDLHF